MAAAFTVRIDDSTLKALDALVEKTNESRDRLAARAIENFIALNDWQTARIGRGLAEADRGEFASEEEIERVRGKFAQS